MQELVSDIVISIGGVVIGIILHQYFFFFFRILDKYCKLSLHRFCCHFHVGWSMK